MRRDQLFLLMVFLACWLSACKQSDRPLTSRQLNKVDSLFYEEVKRMQPALDNFCAQIHDSVYRSAFDSIWQVRLAQNADLIKYGQQ